MISRAAIPTTAATINTLAISRTAIPFTAPTINTLAISRTGIPFTAPTINTLAISRAPIPTTSPTVTPLPSPTVVAVSTTSPTATGLPSPTVNAMVVAASGTALPAVTKAAVPTSVVTLARLTEAPSSSFATSEAPVATAQQTLGYAVAPSSVAAATITPIANAPSTVAPTSVPPSVGPDSYAAVSDPTGGHVPVPTNAVNYDDRDFQAFADLGDFGGLPPGTPELVWLSADQSDTSGRGKLLRVMAENGAPVMGFALSKTHAQLSACSAAVCPLGHASSLLPAAGSGFDVEIPVPGGGGGSITIADYDGDGLPEIGVAGGSYYVVFDPDCISPRTYGGATGTCNRTAASANDCGASPTNPAQKSVLWCRGSQDQTSFITGSSVFDFSGNGRAEVIYADECWLRVYDGVTGSVYFSGVHSSGTKLEEPVIASVTGDGHAQLMMTSTLDYEVTAGVGVACPTKCSTFGPHASDQYAAAQNRCYTCAFIPGATISCDASFNCTCTSAAYPTGTAASFYTVVSDDVTVNGVPQAGVATDRFFAGLPCSVATDCPTFGMACTNNLCRCATDSDCSSDGTFKCIDPPGGPDPVNGKTCRSERCTTPGCGVYGVQVYTGPGVGWANSGSLWNQHAYTPTQIQNTAINYAQVPATSALTAAEAAAWTPSNPRANSFRQQLQSTGASVAASMDLTLEYPCTPNFIPVCNRGGSQAPAGQEVVGFDASLVAKIGYDSTLPITVGPCYTTVPIDPGQCINLACLGAGIGTQVYEVNPFCFNAGAAYATCAKDPDCGVGGRCDLSSHECELTTCKPSPPGNGLPSTPTAECGAGAGNWAGHSATTPLAACVPAGVPPAPSKFTRVWTAGGCAPSFTPQWALFNYDTSEPPFTSIVFSFKAAKDVASLATATAVTVSVAGFDSTTGLPLDVQRCIIPADGNVTLGGTVSYPCPLDLSKILPAPSPTLPVLEMDALFQPSYSGAPTLNSWNVTFDCLPSE
ncbi:MAG: hypothetical protein ACHREM_15195 [Polyangiales bacterium]